MTFDQSLFLAHVVFTTLWFGGGASVAIVALRAGRTTDLEKYFYAGTEIEWFGNRILMPSAVLVFLTGLALAAHRSLFGELWVLIALAAFALSAALALIFLGPVPGALQRLIDAHGPASIQVRDRIRRHIIYNRIEVALLFLVLLDMVLKPGQA